MHIERNEDMLHPKLGENGLELFCYISDAIDETLDEVMAAMIERIDALTFATPNPL